MINGMTLARLRGSRLLRGSAGLLVGSLTASAGAYVFNVVAGRALGPAVYGSVLALVSSLTILSVPAQSMQTMAAREVASAIAHGAGSAAAEARSLHRMAALLAALVLAGFLVLSVPLARTLAIDSRAAVVAVGIAGAASILLSTQRGIIQGRGQFVALSATLVGDPALRLTSFFALLLLGFRIGAPIGAFLVATAGMYALIAVLTRARGTVEAARPLPGFTARLRAMLPYTVAVAAATALYNVDILVARAVLPEQAAGVYGAGAVLGRAVFFIGSSAGMALLPLISAAPTHATRVQYLVEALVFTVGLSGVLVVGYALLPGLVIAATFGAAFEALRGDLWVFGFAMLLYALANLAVSYLIALHRWAVIAPLVATALVQAALLIAWHTDVRTLVLVQIATMLMANATLWPLVAREVRRGAR